MTFIKDWFRHEDNKTGCRFIVVDAYNEERVLKYYDKNGFLPLYKTEGEFYQFNLSSCIRQQNSLTAQFVSFSLSNLANIFYPPNFYNN